MTLREFTHPENVAILTIFKMYGSRDVWPDQISYHIGKSMMANLQRQRLLQSKRVGGETMISLSDFGLSIARSLEGRTRGLDRSERVKIGL